MVETYTVTQKYIFMIILIHVVFLISVVHQKLVETLLVFIWSTLSVRGVLIAINMHIILKSVHVQLDKLKCEKQLEAFVHTTMLYNLANSTDILT